MMSELNDLDLPAFILRIQSGDQHGYTILVQRFQDMAVGYAYAALGDMQLAEDTAQEAFIVAYYTLQKLREPAAFPGWFRRIVHTQIHRLQRKKQADTVPLEQVSAIHLPQLDPSAIIEKRELHNTVYAAI